MIKDKKGIFWIMPIIWVVLLIVLLALLIWFGLRIASGLSAIASFLTSYWIWIFALIVIIVFHNQIKGILKFVLGKLGVKI